MPSRQDLVFLLSPFLLTAVLVVVGYRILVSTTPEASIFVPEMEAPVEILTDGNIEPVTPSTALPDLVVGRIQPLPERQVELDTRLNQAKDGKDTMVYLSIPLTLRADGSVVLNNADRSSEENIIRWTKTTINAFHRQGYHVTLALTLNAETTVTDPATFVAAYGPFLTRFAAIASEYAVNYFGTGLTVGHPMYSSLTAEEANQILVTLGRQARKTYSGRLGVGLCCQTQVSPALGDYSFATLIGTPEVPETALTPLAESLATQFKWQTKPLYYNRSLGVVANYPISIPAE